MLTINQSITVIRNRETWQEINDYLLEPYRITAIEPASCPICTAHPQLLRCTTADGVEFTASGYWFDDTEPVPDPMLCNCRNYRRIGDK